MPAASSTKWESFKKNSKKFGIYLVSLLGAAGTGLQNYMAVAALIKDLMDGAFAATKAGLSIIHSIALAFGGLCSGLVNFCINIGLIENFLERITKKKKPDLKGWQKFRYWFGSGVFVITGLLFGLTALAFGPVGALAAVSIAAGIFVAGIMTIQELETWLESFDDKEETIIDANGQKKTIIKKKKSLKELFIEWKSSLTKRKVVGLVIAVGNVVALSLLFTLGLASFLTGVGVAALPALIIGAVVAFTGGAFTEYYFYNRFLSDFCENIKEKWKAFKETKYPALGMASGIINALVNGVLSYIGIMMITTLLTAASIAMPPIGIVIAITAIAATFAAVASFILGLDFWINNSKKITGYFTKEKSASDKPVEGGDTHSIKSRLFNAIKNKFNSKPKHKEEEQVPLLEANEDEQPIPFVKQASTSGLKRSSIFSPVTIANDTDTVVVEPKSAVNFI
jgi:hypothetical protein